MDIIHNKALQDIVALYLLLLARILDYEWKDILMDAIITVAPKVICTGEDMITDFT
jgi:hypothetical protein